MNPFKWGKESDEEIIPENPTTEHVEEEEEDEGDDQTEILNQDITECFEIFDRQNFGYIELKHVEKALSCLGVFISKVELDELLESLDTNGATLEQFRTFALEKMLELDEYDALRSAFVAFDLDHEGILPTDRMKKWLTTLGNPFTDKEFKEFCKFADPENSGVIKYEAIIGPLLAK